jgi:hypothetical protein
MSSPRRVRPVADREREIGGRRPPLQLLMFQAAT